MAWIWAEASIRKRNMNTKVQGRRRKETAKMNRESRERGFAEKGTRNRVRLRELV